MKKYNNIIIASVLLAMITSAQAEQTTTDGPLIKGYGRHYAVEQSIAVPENTKFKVAFDVSEQTSSQELNRRFDSLARFLNMHAANGVKPENIELALIVHGKAGFDILSNQAYQKRFQQDNPNSELLGLLQKHNTQIFICGQSAAYYQIANQDVAPGVQVALSAMTANALLQQQGYTLNPF